MNKLIAITIAAAALVGCKHVTVETADWSASYFALGQENDVKGMKIKAGENVALEIEQVKSNIDPAVAKAMEAAASALALAARACAAYASGGTSEAAVATASALSAATSADPCPGGVCDPK